MDCADTCHEARTRGQLASGEGPAEDRAQTISDRQAAVAFLQAARLTDDAVVREQLRRRGADLLRPRRFVPYPRRPS